MLQRTTISFFGRTNAGKSSLVNALTAQDVSIVSDIKGTTTDPVKKVMELLPIGPVTIIDTPGLDDTSLLGEKRIARTHEVLSQTQIAVVVCDATRDDAFGQDEQSLVLALKEKNIPYVIVFNKWDLQGGESLAEGRAFACESIPAVLEASKVCGGISAFESVSKAVGAENVLKVSAAQNTGIFELKEKLGSLKGQLKTKPLVSDLVSRGDVVVLVIPIDESAPKDRLILPQQMVLRELLEVMAVPVCVQVENLAEVFKKFGSKPSLVITDSQAFQQVSRIVPEDVPLTSFSILMARFKGTLEYSLECTRALESLNDGDKVLISEGCTHHRQCKDIGTVKMPAWVQNYTQKKLAFEFSSGGTFPSDLKEFKLVIHCGGCMLNEMQMASRLEQCKEQGVPVTNYGMAIAYMNGILPRSLAPLGLSED